jgi:hypothetical protein
MYNYLTTTAAPGLDLDLLNALRLVQHGVALVAPDAAMPAPLYDALAFAQTNDVQQFILSPEWTVAVQEHVVDLIGVTHWF